ncbi:sensor histidine kinase [Moritella sp. F3]|uniref:sensor histidine kinase n=1 Tax=Moritella sp. F3 TaxID=2718882 RepID=UPI0018E16675|nr:sensor histidine kinase [Moritella sp. F3]GIC77397.1 sensor histidine kinase [Moritella sp. F1]GIC83320.1 sensor histidine kinase [Moritella sp. F3]
MANVLIKAVIGTLLLMMTQVHASNATDTTSSNSRNSNADPFIDDRTLERIADNKPTMITVDVGVLATRGIFEAKQRWQPTLLWLQSQIPNSEFRLHPFTLAEMEAAVEQQSVDVVVTNPGQAVRLGRQYPLSWLATLNSKLGDGTHVIGSALVVRADSHYQHLVDVSGDKIAAVASNAFGGYLTMQLTVQNLGINPTAFFSDVSFLGFPVDAIIYQLRDGYVDAAVVPVCQLESMLEEGLIQKGVFRVLDDISPDNFACALSTQLYPNWSIAKTSAISASLAKKITRALLALPSDHAASIAAYSSGWTPPISQLSVDQLYRDLDMHPLQRPWWQEAAVWIKKNQQWAWVVFLFVLVLSIYHLILEYRFSRSERKLKATLNRLKEKNAMLEHAQRVAIVGELGSSLAHEINQPLAAILNYSQGGLLRINKGADASAITPALEKIQQQVKRADGIVQRLRTLINKRAVAKSRCDVQALLSDTLELLEYDFQQKNITVSQSCVGNAVDLDADIVGLQQVLLNVLNNAADACLMRDPAVLINNKISIESHYSDDRLILTVTDNGIGLTASSAELQNAFFTTKKEGLGLGLAICRDVVEAHHGQFSLVAADPIGCRVSIQLPLQ